MEPGGVEAPLQSGVLRVLADGVLVVGQGLAPPPLLLQLLAAVQDFGNLAAGVGNGDGGRKLRGCRSGKEQRDCCQARAKTDRTDPAWHGVIHCCLGGHPPPLATYATLRSRSDGERARLGGEQAGKRVRSPGLFKDTSHLAAHQKFRRRNRPRPTPTTRRNGPGRSCGNGCRRLYRTNTLHKSCRARIAVRKSPRMPSRRRNVDAASCRVPGWDDAGRTRQDAASTETARIVCGAGLATRRP